jgi:hypothetical protein
MVLRMPCPTKRTGSDNWYYRSKIPTDIQAILQTLPKERRPSGWYKTHISISLGTADRATAKEKCGEVTARVERQLKAFREGPRALTAKQIAALSGIAYRAFTEQLEANPGLTVEGWLNVAEANEAAKRGNPLLIAKNDAERQAISMEHRFGGLADATLLGEGIVTDNDSRWKLVEALARDLTEMAKKLARNADGDYSPDAYVTRFPAPTEAKPSAQVSHSLMLGTLPPSLETFAPAMRSGGGSSSSGSRNGYAMTTYAASPRRGFKRGATNEAPLASRRRQSTTPTSLPCGPCLLGARNAAGFRPTRQKTPRSRGAGRREPARSISCRKR